MGTTNFNNTTNITTTINAGAQVAATVTNGARGKSAYEVWLSEGHTGSATDFLNWLKSDSYKYFQDSAASTWEIQHNLGKFPSVTIVDSAGRVVYGDVEYIDQNNLKVSFTATFSGRAYLN